MKALLKYQGEEKVVKISKKAQSQLIKAKKIWLEEGDSENYSDIISQFMDYLGTKLVKAFKIEDIETAKDKSDSIKGDYLEIDLDNVSSDTVVVEYVVDCVVDYDDTEKINPIYDESLSISERLEASFKQIKAKPLKLYWVFEGDEDWFIITYEDILAHDFHNEYEGMGDNNQSQHFELLMMKDLEEENELRDIKIPSSNGEEENEDYYEEDIFVEEIMELPKDFLSTDDDLLDSSTIARHAQIEDLEKLGFKIIDNGEISGQRIVKLNDRTFREGSLEMNIRLAQM